MSDSRPFNYVTLLCCLLLQWFNEELEPTAYLAEPAPNNCIIVVDGHRHSFAFSCADFLKILLKIAIHLDGRSLIQ